MRDGIGLIPDQVIQSVGRVGVNEAVAHPFARSNAAPRSARAKKPLPKFFFDQTQARVAAIVDGPVVNVRDQLKGRFDPILFDLVVSHRRVVVLLGVTKDVESVVADQAHQLAILRPIDLSVPIAVLPRQTKTDQDSKIEERGRIVEHRHEPLEARPRFVGPKRPSPNRTGRHRLDL